MVNVILATSNGTGLGHLSRQTSIGLAMGTSAEPTLFSLSTGLPLASNTGIQGEYCPSYTYPYIDPAQWNDYLSDRLVALVEETEPTVVAFDGVLPYLGIGKAALRLPDVAFVWIRRGLWRNGTQAALRRSGFFDLVIEPGDLGGDTDTGPTARACDAVKVAPVSLGEVIQPMSRADAREALNLPADGAVALVALGSGQHGDTKGPRDVARDAVLADPDFHLVVATRDQASDVPSVARISDRVTAIANSYPLVRYLAAFDVAVGSAGYNQVHEFVPAGLPALYIANTSTRSDNQELRGARIAELGLGLFAVDTDLAEIERQCTRLLEQATRDDISALAQETHPSLTGASAAAALIAGAEPTDSDRRSRSITDVARREAVRSSIEPLLGRRLRQALRRKLGRYPLPDPEQLTVTTGNDEASGHPSVRVSESLSVADLQECRPVEHARPNSSTEYLQRRQEIVHRYYRVAD